MFLALSGRQCRVDGCNNTAGMYGVCAEHEDERITEVFNECVAKGWATHEKPACFRDHREWRYYVVAWRLSVRQLNGNSRLQVEYCRDCTPAYKAQMKAEDRCGHHETIFIRPHLSPDEVTGIPIFDFTRTGKWQSAIMSMGCDVVDLPDDDVVAACLERIAYEATPKKRGRKPKSVEVSS